MQLEWSFTAGSYLDQLPSLEQSRVLRAVEQLPASWDSLEGNRLYKLTGDEEDLFALRVGSNLRVLVRRQGNILTVVDVVQRGQIDGLRRIARQHQATPG